MQGTALSATSSGIHIQCEWEKEGTRDDKPGNAALTAISAQGVLVVQLQLVAGWPSRQEREKMDKGWRESSQNLPAHPESQYSYMPGQLKGWFWRALGIEMNNFSILQPGCDSK